MAVGAENGIMGPGPSKGKAPTRTLAKNSLAPAIGSKPEPLGAPVLEDLMPPNCMHVEINNGAVT